MLRCWENAIPALWFHFLPVKWCWLCWVISKLPLEQISYCLVPYSDFFMQTVHFSPLYLYDYMWIRLDLLVSIWRSLTSWMALTLSSQKKSILMGLRKGTGPIGLSHFWVLSIEKEHFIYNHEWTVLRGAGFMLPGETQWTSMSNSGGRMGKPTCSGSRI